MKETLRIEEEQTGGQAEEQSFKKIPPVKERPSEEAVEKTRQEILDPKTRVMIIKFCRKLLGGKNLHFAEDVAQETLNNAYNHAEEFERRSKFSTWLYIIARNIVFTQYHKNRTAEKYQPKLKKLESIRIGDSDLNFPGEWAIAKVDFERAFEKLPEDKRQIIDFLRRGFTIEELAQLYKIGVPDTKLLVFRAKDEFEKILRKMEIIPPPAIDFDKALPQLREDYREVINLLRAKFTNQDVMEHYKITLAAAKARIHRARAELEAVVKEMEAETKK